MRNIRLALLLLFAVAAAADSKDYKFVARVMPHPTQGYLLQTTVQGPDGEFTAFSTIHPSLDGQTITVERGKRMYRIVLDVDSAGDGTAEFEVMENGAMIAKDRRSFAAQEPPPRQTDEKYPRLDRGTERPVVVKRVEPVYTEEARKARISGIVILEVKISDAGVVDEVQVLKPLPFGLDQAAVDAVKQWVFKPAMRDGKPVPVTFNLTINFMLPARKQ